MACKSKFGSLSTFGVAPAPQARPYNRALSPPPPSSFPLHTKTHASTSEYPFHHSCHQKDLQRSSSHHGKHSTPLAPSETPHRRRRDPMSCFLHFLPGRTMFILRHSHPAFGFATSGSRIVGFGWRWALPTGLHPASCHRFPSHRRICTAVAVCCFETLLTSQYRQETRFQTHKQPTTPPPPQQQQHH